MCNTLSDCKANLVSGFVIDFFLHVTKLAFSVVI